VQNRRRSFAATPACAYTNVGGALSHCSLTMILLLAKGALCQSPAPPDPRECAGAAERLQAESMREKAWGAYLAAACTIPSLAGEIGAELERLHPQELARLTWDSESFWAGRTMLDALIQLHEPLEASLLTSISQGFPTEATILALQDELRNGPLLAALRRAHYIG